MDAAGDPRLVSGRGLRGQAVNAVDFEARGLPPPLFTFVYLPGGLCQGFVTVTLAYALRHNGVSVAAIAGLVGLHILPTTWKFVMGPVLDMSLTSRRWYVICIAVMAACLAGFGLAPLNASATPLLSLLSLASGVAAAGAGSSATAAMALTTPNAARGRVAGWMQTGNLGGIGVGGGVGLWLASHAGGPTVAALAVALICVLCAWPMLLMRVPPRPAGETLPAQARALGSTLWTLARTRLGVMAALAVTLPAGLGAAANLLPAASGDWRASADLVALTTGILGGLATVPGCIVGGYLCDRFPRRPVFICAAYACAAGEAAMALAPHTPLSFTVFVLLNQLLLGVAWACVSAVIYECLGRTGAATVAALLSSLCNLPVVVVTVLVGAVQTRHGSAAMLLTEAGLAVVSLTGYALLAWWWRPGAAAPLPALAAVS